MVERLRSLNKGSRACPPKCNVGGLRKGLLVEGFRVNRKSTFNSQPETINPERETQNGEPGTTTDTEPVEV